MRIIFFSFFSLYGIRVLLRNLDLGLSTILVFIIPIAVGIIHYFILDPIIRPERRIRWTPPALKPTRTLGLGLLLGLCFILLFVAILRIRIANFHAIWLLFVFLFLYAVIRSNQEVQDPLQLLRDLSISLMVFVSLNGLSLLFNFQNPTEVLNYQRGFSTLFNLMGERYYFPFTSSTRYLSICAGVALILVLFTPPKTVGKENVFYKIGTAGLCGLVMIASGARLPAMLLLLALGLGVFWKKIGRKGVIVGVILAVLLPLFVLAIAGLHEVWLASGPLSPLVEEIFNALTFSNRHIIWRTALDHAFSDLRTALFGHGVNGHLLSGASRDYGYLFEVSYTRPYEMAVHNSYVQLILDGGLLGLGSFLALIAGILWKLPEISRQILAKGEENEFERVISIVLFYLLSTAAAEVSLSYLAPEVLYMFVLILLIIVIGPSRSVLMERRMGENSIPAPALREGG